MSSHLISLYMFLLTHIYSLSIYYICSFRTLVTKDDDEAIYGPRFFYEDHTENFSFIIMTARAEIPKDLSTKFFVVHVV